MLRGGARECRSRSGLVPGSGGSGRTTGSSAESREGGETREGAHLGHVHDARAGLEMIRGDVGLHQLLDLLDGSLRGPGGEEGARGGETGTSRRTGETDKETEKLSAAAGRAPTGRRGERARAASRTPVGLSRRAWTRAGARERVLRARRPRRRGRSGRVKKLVVGGAWFARFSQHQERTHPLLLLRLRLGRGGHLERSSLHHVGVTSSASLARGVTGARAAAPWK